MLRFKKLWKKAGNLTELDVVQVIVAQRMGWTLETVESLSEYDLRRVLGVLDGINRSNKKPKKK